MAIADDIKVYHDPVNQEVGDTIIVDEIEPYGKGLHENLMDLHRAASYERAINPPVIVREPDPARGTNRTWREIWPGTPEPAPEPEPSPAKILADQLYISVEDAQRLLDGMAVHASNMIAYGTSIIKISPDHPPQVYRLVEDEKPRQPSLSTARLVDTLMETNDTFADLTWREDIDDE